MFESVDSDDFSGVKKENFFSGKFSVCCEEENENGKSSKIFGEDCIVKSEGGGGKCRVRADNARSVRGVIKGSQISGLTRRLTD